MRKLVEMFKRDVFQPFRFLMIGGLATATHMLVATLLFRIDDRLSAYLINLVAFLVAFIVSFLGHRYITFQTEGSIYRFFLVAMGGFLANNTILTVCLAIGTGSLTAVIIAAACVPVLTYLASSLWAFRKKEN